MEFTMMSPAKGHGELIADFARERPALRELKMMRVRRAAAAGQAGLGAHELQMVSIPQPNWFGQRGDLLTDSLVSCVDDGRTLVCGAMLPRAISVELASRIGFVGWQDCFSVEPAVAVCDHRFAVAVGLGSR